MSHSFLLSCALQGNSTWEHPLDGHFRAMHKAEKEKRAAGLPSEQAASGKENQQPKELLQSPQLQLLQPKPLQPAKQSELVHAPGPGPEDRMEDRAEVIDDEQARSWWQKAIGSARIRVTGMADALSSWMEDAGISEDDSSRLGILAVQDIARDAGGKISGHEFNAFVANFLGGVFTVRKMQEYAAKQGADGVDGAIGRKRQQKSKGDGNRKLSAVVLSPSHVEAMAIALDVDPREELGLLHIIRSAATAALADPSDAGWKLTEAEAAADALRGAPSLHGNSTVASFADRVAGARAGGEDTSRTHPWMQFVDTHTKTLYYHNFVANERTVNCPAELQGPAVHPEEPHVGSDQKDKKRDKARDRRKKEQKKARREKQVMRRQRQQQREQENDGAYEDEYRENDQAGEWPDDATRSANNRPELVPNDDGHEGPGIPGGGGGLDRMYDEIFQDAGGEEPCRDSELNGMASGGESDDDDTTGRSRRQGAARGPDEMEWDVDGPFGGQGGLPLAGMGGGGGGGGPHDGAAAAGGGGRYEMAQLRDQLKVRQLKAGGGGGLGASPAGGAGQVPIGLKAVPARLPTLGGGGGGGGGGAFGGPDDDNRMAVTGMPPMIMGPGSSLSGFGQPASGPASGSLLRGGGLPASDPFQKPSLGGLGGGSMGGSGPGGGTAVPELAAFSRDLPARKPFKPFLVAKPPAFNVNLPPRGAAADSQRMEQMLSIDHTKGAKQGALSALKPLGTLGGMAAAPIAHGMAGGGLSGGGSAQRQLPLPLGLPGLHGSGPPVELDQFGAPKLL